MARAMAGRPPGPGASRSQVSRKSFLAPCALVNGIFMGRPAPVSWGAMSVSYAPVKVDHRLEFLDDGQFQLVANAIGGGELDGGIHWVAALHHGPFVPKEQVGAPQRRDPRQSIADAERLAHRDAHLAIDAGQIVAARCDNSRAAHVTGCEERGGLMHPRAAALGISARFGPG